MPVQRRQQCRTVRSGRPEQIIFHLRVLKVPKKTHSPQAPAALRAAARRAAVGVLPPSAEKTMPRSDTTDNAEGAGEARTARPRGMPVHRDNSLLAQPITARCPGAPSLGNCTPCW